MGVGALYAVTAERPEVAETVLKNALKQGVRLEQVFCFQGTTSKNLNWTIQADEVLLEQDNNLVVFKRFRLRVTPQNGATLTLKGQEGKYLRSQGTLLLKGDLVGRSQEGYKVTTQSAMFDQKEGSLRGTEKIEMQGPFFSVTGQGFFADLKNRVVRIDSGVTATINGVREKDVL